MCGVEPAAVSRTRSAAQKLGLASVVLEASADERGRMPWERVHRCQSHGGHRRTEKTRTRQITLQLHHESRRWRRNVLRDKGRPMH